MPRGRCHHSIRNAFSAAITRFVRENPHIMQSSGFEKGIDGLQRLMVEVLDIIDQFEISDKIVETKDDERK